MPLAACPCAPTSASPLEEVVLEAVALGRGHILRVRGSSISGKRARRCRAAQRQVAAAAGGVAARQAPPLVPSSPPAAIAAQQGNGAAGVGQEGARSPERSPPSCSGGPWGAGRACSSNPRPLAVQRLLRTTSRARWRGWGWLGAPGRAGGATGVLTGGGDRAVRGLGGLGGGERSCARGGVLGLPVVH